MRLNLIRDIEIFTFSMIDRGTLMLPILMSVFQLFEIPMMIDPLSHQIQG